MHSMQYQRWNPPQSPVRVEFPPQLMAEVAREPGEARGSLYGLLMGGEIRVLAARTSGGKGREKEGRLTGLEKIGIFVRRARGEVFLTESDLECFEGQRAAVALVVAGERAGFFVRQADGSIQTVRSHEEFMVSTQEAVPYRPDSEPDNPVIHPKTAALALSTANRHAPSHPGTPTPAGPVARRWHRAATVFVAIPLAALAYFRPLAIAPIQLQLQQTGDAVAISWNPRATARGGHLEILDGAKSARLEVGSGESSLTYLPGSRLVQVRMAVDFALGQPQQESAMLAVEAPAAPAPRADVPIESLEAEVSQLQWSLDNGRERISRLQEAIGKLTRR